VLEPWEHGNIPVRGTPVPPRGARACAALTPILPERALTRLLRVQSPTVRDLVAPVGRLGARASCPPQCAARRARHPHSDNARTLAVARFPSVWYRSRSRWRARDGGASFAAEGTAGGAVSTPAPTSRCRVHHCLLARPRLQRQLPRRDCALLNCGLNGALSACRPLLARPARPAQLVRVGVSRKSRPCGARFKAYSCTPHLRACSGADPARPQCPSKQCVTERIARPDGTKGY
jgi:hypothetical protein